jgi:hypothetical protein
MRADAYTNFCIYDKFTIVRETIQLSLYKATHLTIELLARVVD